MCRSSLLFLLPLLAAGLPQMDQSGRVNELCITIICIELHLIPFLVFNWEIMHWLFTWHYHHHNCNPHYDTLLIALLRRWFSQYPTIHVVIVMIFTIPFIFALMTFPQVMMGQKRVDCDDGATMLEVGEQCAVTWIKVNLGKPGQLYLSHPLAWFSWYDFVCFGFSLVWLVL